MKTLLHKKLDRISDIWNNYIWEYKFCNSRIKFTLDVRSNYFGDILRYFSDTLELIYNENKSESFSINLESAIGFLQSIYVQQDFTEELLHIFKCNINKGYLKLDINYSLNRDIRNELIGHPIRKKTTNNNTQLLSSAIFSNSINSSSIAYIRYHKDTNYEFEEVIHHKYDIRNRHEIFLNIYLDKIIDKLKNILNQFKSKIEEIESVIKNASFSSILNIVNNSFENIIKTNYLYDKDSLLCAYELENTSPRYKNLVDIFINDLKLFIQETKQSINEQLSDKDHTNINYHSTDNVPYKIVFDKKRKKSNNIKPITFDYELEKLIENKGFHEFKLISSILKEKFLDNEIVLNEIDNMERNLSNKFEYYCSYYYIDTLLSSSKRTNNQN
ncbi:hypothetical protein [Hymenobacter nivis]|uniref:Uncharacterized protein n=1 Tax=Hymenobacter nivis TaxID=1850093 RepID=A0A502GUE9_9BACT|nr:hypothetical protein [Hymenobacter nivis]TPG65561.1 hypothetical protein EAH73_13975 [Hymenobacter nivis]